MERSIISDLRFQIDDQLAIADCGIADWPPGAAANRSARTYQLTGQILAVKPETQRNPRQARRHSRLHAGDDHAVYGQGSGAAQGSRRRAILITATLVVGADARVPVGDHQDRVGAAAGGRAHDDSRGGGRRVAADRRRRARHAADRSGRQADLAEGLSRARRWRSPLSTRAVRCRSICPLMDRRFAEVQALVGRRSGAGGQGPAAVDQLRSGVRSRRGAAAHARKLGADPAVWRFATAEEAIVDRLAARFGVNVIREKDGTITHNLRTAVIDPSGRVDCDPRQQRLDRRRARPRALKNAVAAAR